MERFGKNMKMTSQCIANTVHNHSKSCQSLKINVDLPILQSFKKGFDEVVQKYVLSKNTPIKPSKKKAKGRIEKLDSQGMSLFFHVH